MTVNTDLLEKTLAVIVARPQGWDQSTWISAVPDATTESCGTTACLAGHALIQSGDFRQVKIIWDYEINDEREFNPEADEVTGEFDLQFIHKDEAWSLDTYVDPFFEAAERLGLDDGQAEHLFYQTQDMVWDSADQFADYVREYLKVNG